MYRGTIASICWMVFGALRPSWSVLYHMPPYVQRWFYFPNSFLAVDFFFCLSGFIIAYSYERRILERNEPCRL